MVHTKESQLPRIFEKNKIMHYSIAFSRELKRVASPMLYCNVQTHCI